MNKLSMKMTKVFIDIKNTNFIYVFNLNLTDFSIFYVFFAFNYLYVFFINY